MNTNTGPLTRIVVAPIKALALMVRSLVKPVWWTLPIVVAIISHFVPLLDQPIKNGVPEPTIWLLVMIQVVVVIIIWLVANMVIVNNKDTTTAELQYDHLVSCSVTGAMLIALGALLVGFDVFGVHFELTWGYLVPLLGAVLDMYLTGHIGLNNAAQKPFLDRDRG